MMFEAPQWHVDKAEAEEEKGSFVEIGQKKGRKGKRRKKPRMTLSWKSMRAHLQSEAGLLMGYVSPRPSAILPRP